jgi:hypothetical protein
MMLSSAVKHYSKYYYKHPLTRHGEKLAPIETQRVYPVLSAEQLLQKRGRRKVMDQVRVSCGAPIEHFNVLYKQLIENFVEFIQYLPMANNHRLTRLDRQLHLGSLALSLREPYLLAGELLNRTTDREKALWNYVMFSGLLLSRLGQVVTQYNVSLCDEKGVYQQTWEPFHGSMNDQGSHYKIRSIEAKTTPVDSQLNVMIARQLMPEEGYRWIASVPEALEQWILTLDSSGERGAESLVARFFVVLESWLSEQNRTLEGEAGEILEKYLEELFDDYVMEESYEAELPSEQSREPVETLIGERFFQWMRKGIQDNRLSVNLQDSALFMTKQGVLMLHPKLINQFVKENPGIGTGQEVFDQFSKLGLAANNQIENYLAKFPGMRDQDMKGVLLKDASLLFGSKEPPPLTPYVNQGNFLKKATENLVQDRFQQQEQLAHTKEVLQQAKETAIEKSEKQNLPSLKQEVPSYKNYTLTNRPPKR